MTDEEFFDILYNEMDLPKWRIETQDWGWLLRNIMFRNANHPKYDDVVDILKRKYKEKYSQFKHGL